MERALHAKLPTQASTDQLAAASDVRLFLPGGEPLEPQTRTLMESRFGTDFGDIRVHTDSQAAAIIRIAQDTSRTEDQRAIAVVRAILDTYYPGDGALVRNITYNANDPGLTTTSVGTGSTAQGDVAVGRYFLTHTDPAGLARRVLQVWHELQHIRQYRASMGGQNRRHEREFLAFHWEATAPERMGTGTVSHSTRVALIDAALGHYFCLDPTLQTQYAVQRDELLAARATHQTASGNPATAAPTTCVP